MWRWAHTLASGKTQGGYPDDRFNDTPQHAVFGQLRLLRKVRQRERTLLSPQRDSNGSEFSAKNTDKFPPDTTACYG